MRKLRVREVCHLTKDHRAVSRRAKCYINPSESRRCLWSPQCHIHNVAWSPGTWLCHHSLLVGCLRIRYRRLLGQCLAQSKQALGNSYHRWLLVLLQRWIWGYVCPSLVIFPKCAHLPFGEITLTPYHSKSWEETPTLPRRSAYPPQ